MVEELRRVLRRNLEHSLRVADLEQAGILLERLKIEDPLSVETRGLELDFLIHARRFDEAQSLSSQLLELFPASPRIQYLAGLLACRTKRYAEGEIHLRESEKLHAHWRTRLWLGKALTQLGRLDEAEAILVGLLPQHPNCRTDLAWLYERKQEGARAMKLLQEHLLANPGDSFAQSQLRRLEARAVSPEELREEVDTLAELGEEVDPDVLPEYIEVLLRSGDAGRARSVIRERMAALGPKHRTRVGWACYKLQAYDMAFDLFCAAFAENRADFKFLAALECAADRCGRTGELLRLYKSHAESEKRLYGRMKTLSARLQTRRQ